MLSSDPKSAPIDPRLVSLSRPTSFEAEQYRQLRRRVEEMAVERGFKVFAVTSAVASDGKTLTAVNLAGALAQARRSRVLLIDADLRQPSVTTRLSLELDSERGLIPALSAPTARLRDFVGTVPGTRLTVLPCATSRADPYEVLKSGRFRSLIDQARNEFDFVIVDTPPLIPVPDTTLLTTIVDTFLVVISAHATPRKLVAESLNLLPPQAVAGLVFNRDDRPLFGYYGSRYHAYFQNYVKSLDEQT